MRESTDALRSDMVLCSRCGLSEVQHVPGDHAFAASVRDSASELAGRLSWRPLTPKEAAAGVDIIFDLLAEHHQLQVELDQAHANIDLLLAEVKCHLG